MNANWGHASAQQAKRVLVDSEGGNLHRPAHIDEVLERCEGCRAPHAPFAGTSMVSMFNEKQRVDPLFLGEIVALHVIDVFPK